MSQYFSTNIPAGKRELSVCVLGKHLNKYYYSMFHVQKYVINTKLIMHGIWHFSEDQNIKKMCYYYRYHNPAGKLKISFSCL